MENNQNKKSGNLRWVWFSLAALFILVIIAVVVLGITITNAIQDTTMSFISPITEANDQIQTQVAEILHPTPTIIPDPISIVHEVRSLARLETIQYTVEKVITAEVGQGNFAFLFGDRILFVAHGTVIAGVDLRLIESDDVWIEDNALFVSLPAPEVFVTSLNNEQSYVYDREVGFLSKGNQDLETQARQAAEEEILRTALEDGILEKAKVNGEVFLEKFLESLGFDDVVFLYQSEENLE